MGRGITRRSFHTDGDSRAVRCGLDALSSVTIPRPSSCMFGNGRSDGCSDAQSSAQRAGSMPEVVPKAVPEETVEAMPEAIRSHAGAPVRVTARQSGPQGRRGDPRQGPQLWSQTTNGVPKCKDDQDTRSQRVRCAQRGRIKRLLLAAMKPNEEPIIESGTHFHEGGRRKGARILDGQKEQAARRKMQPAEPTKPESRQQPCEGYD